LNLILNLEKWNTEKIMMTSLRNKVRHKFFKFQIEIEEYARYLGMNPAEDRDLMWIPEQGVFLKIYNN